MPPLHTFSQSYNAASAAAMMPSNRSFRLFQMIFPACIACTFLLLIIEFRDILQLPLNSSPPSEKAEEIILDKTKSVQRIDEYCSRTSNAQYLKLLRAGAERSQFDDYNQYELRTLVWTIRHGDRSAIHSLPGYMPQNDNAKVHMFSPEVSNYVKRLNNIELRFLKSPSNSTYEQKYEDLNQALNSSIMFRRSDTNLPHGQLTSTGFMQHVRLGEALNTAYSPFLSSIKKVEDEIYIRSTNYGRTIQSAAGLITAALPGILASKYRIPIYTFNDESDEVMHGVGLRSSSHGVSSPGQASTETSGMCKNAVGAAKRQQQSIKAHPLLHQKLKELFGESILALAAPEIVDTSIPFHCHGQPLPCVGEKGSGKCMSPSLLASLMEDADHYYCQRFSGRRGGQEATNLALYPFLSEILSHLKAAASPVSDRKLSVFSGHDTVIAPVLSALGVYNQPRLCGWPSYASRIIFELYGRKESPPTGGKPFHTAVDEYWRNKAFAVIKAKSIYTADSGTVVNNSASGDSPLLSHPPASDYFVRVVYNGRDITQLIPACVEERSVLAKAVVAGKVDSLTPEQRKFLSADDRSFPLCSLAALESQVLHMISPHKDVESACNNAIINK